jgi:hypothetical protein
MFLLRNKNIQTRSFQKWQYSKSEELSCLKEFGKNDADAHFGVNEIAPGTCWNCSNLCLGKKNEAIWKFQASLVKFLEKGQRR